MAPQAVLMSLPVGAFTVQRSFLLSKFFEKLCVLFNVCGLIIFRERLTSMEKLTS